MRARHPTKSRPRRHILHISSSRFHYTFRIVAADAVREFVRVSKILESQAMPRTYSIGVRDKRGGQRDSGARREAARNLVYHQMPREHRFSPGH